MQEPDRTEGAEQPYGSEEQQGFSHEDTDMSLYRSHSHADQAESAAVAVKEELCQDLRDREADCGSAGPVHGGCGTGGQELS